MTLAGWASSPTETKLLKQVIRGFEKTFPSVKVNYTPISGDFTAAMLAKFSARTPPDVLYVDSNVAPDWIKQKVLQPLDPYIAKSKLKKEQFYPSLLSGFTGPDKKIYGFPKDWSPLAMETNTGSCRLQARRCRRRGRSSPPRRRSCKERSRAVVRSASRRAGTGCWPSSTRTAARS